MRDAQATAPAAERYVAAEIGGTQVEQRASLGRWPERVADDAAVGERARGPEFAVHVGDDHVAIESTLGVEDGQLRKRRRVCGRARRIVTVRSFVL